MSATGGSAFFNRPFKKSIKSTKPVACSQSLSPSNINSTIYFIALSSSLTLLSDKFVLPFEIHSKQNFFAMAGLKKECNKAAQILKSFVGMYHLNEI